MTNEISRSSCDSPGNRRTRHVGDEQGVLSISESSGRQAGFSPDEGTGVYLALLKWSLLAVLPSEKEALQLVARQSFNREATANALGMRQSAVVPQALAMQRFSRHDPEHRPSRRRSFERARRADRNAECRRPVDQGDKRPYGSDRSHSPCQRDEIAEAGSASNLRASRTTAMIHVRVVVERSQFLNCLPVIPPDG